MTAIGGESIWIALRLSCLPSVFPYRLTFDLARSLRKAGLILVLLPIAAANTRTPGTGRSVRPRFRGESRMDHFLLTHGSDENDLPDVGWDHVRGAKIDLLEQTEHSFFAG